MRNSVILILCFTLAFSGFASAADVAYLYKNSNAVPDGFLDVFDDMGFDVDMINTRDIPSTDFSGYAFVFIGDERLRNLRYLPDMPMILANRYYGEELGFIERGKISSIVSQRPLTVEENPNTQVYEKASYKIGGPSIPYYFIPNKYQHDDAISVAKTSVGSKTRAGDVVSYLPGKCFFGIVEADYWTDEAEEMFEDCVNSVFKGLIHDVEMPVGYTNSVDGVKIKDLEAGRYLMDSVAVLNCNKKYTISFRTTNVGDYTEDVDFDGEFGSFTWSATKNDLAVGKTTTTGSKTINVTQAPGFYDIEVFAHIDDDDTPFNNQVSRTVQVVC
jgi:hypothetical protein